MNGRANHEPEPDEDAGVPGESDSPARPNAHELDSVASEALEARLAGEPQTGMDPEVGARAEAMERARAVLGDDGDAPGDAAFESLLGEAMRAGRADPTDERSGQQIASVPTPLHSPRRPARRALAAAAAAAVVVVLGGIGVMALDDGTPTASSATDPSDAVSGAGSGLGTDAEESVAGQTGAGEPSAEQPGDQSGATGRSQDPGPGDPGEQGAVSEQDEFAESADAASAPAPQAAISALSGLEFTIVVPISGR